MQRLAGKRATDVCDASEPFMDRRTRSYDPGLLSLFGLEEHERQLAPSLPEGTPVHNGPFDLPATAMGAGVGELGNGVVIVGTTLACEVLTDHVDTSGEPGGQNLCTLDPDRWLRAMPAVVGTASMDLTLGLIGATHDEIENFLAESPPGANGVHVLPFFSATGIDFDRTEWARGRRPAHQGAGRSLRGSFACYRESVEAARELWTKAPHVTMDL